MGYKREQSRFVLLTDGARQILARKLQETSRLLVMLPRSLVGYFQPAAAGLGLSRWIRRFDTNELEMSDAEEVQCADDENLAL